MIIILSLAIVNGFITYNPEQYLLIPIILSKKNNAENEHLAS